MFLYFISVWSWLVQDGQALYYITTKAYSDFEQEMVVCLFERHSENNVASLFLFIYLFL